MYISKTFRKLKIAAEEFQKKKLKKSKEFCFQDFKEMNKLRGKTAFS